MWPFFRSWVMFSRNCLILDSLLILRNLRWHWTYLWFLAGNQKKSFFFFFFINRTKNELQKNQQLYIVTIWKLFAIQTECPTCQAIINIYQSTFGNLINSRIALLERWRCWKSVGKSVIVILLFSSLLTASPSSGY